jgi:cyclomaltodextrinase / maltogenic alpha-amylase / neopullulanase
MWTDHAIWWHVYPLGFTGAERALADLTSEPHRFGHLENWLDHAIELGCSGVLLGPVFASETHGYDTIDHFRIDPRLGTDEDFDQLVAAAHARGLRVALDGVFNHVARSFAGPHEWFRRTDEGLAYFEGHDHLVALDHELPAVRRYVVDVMTHWLARGVDAWRLDAAYAVPASFWRDVLAEVRARYPEAWFFGELIHGDYAAYAQESTLDSITQYELWKAIWSSLNDRNFYELASALERHDQFLDAFVPQTFVGNHDVTRIASKLTDERHLGHAVAILFTVAGIPSVYAGDEFGWPGVKEDRAGGDDAIRQLFPDKPGKSDPLYQELIGVRRRNPWLVRARTTVEHLTNEAVALRSSADGQSLVLLLNVSDEPYHFPLEVAEPVVEAHGWKLAT